MTENQRHLPVPQRSSYARASLRVRLGMKRLFDIAASLLLLLLLSPLFLVIAVISFVRQGRPVWYSQTRIGRYGHQFKMHKFRTMSVDADERKAKLLEHNERDGPLFKIADDPRVTPFGHFLRRTSFDELPQLLNVLTGSMSLVGPRPALPEEVHHFSEELRQRELFPQGITGSWQVEAETSADFSLYAELDREYLATWSLHKDLWLLVRTPAAIVRHAKSPEIAPEPTETPALERDLQHEITPDAKRIAG
jgi:lipopolysaccharide/colanic/teichoic acid biosynthesis glycosyltransferase